MYSPERGKYYPHYSRRSRRRWLDLLPKGLRREPLPQVPEIGNVIKIGGPGLDLFHPPDDSL